MNHLTTLITSSEHTLVQRAEQVLQEFFQGALDIYGFLASQKESSYLEICGWIPYRTFQVLWKGHWMVRHGSLPG